MNGTKPKIKWKRLVNFLNRIREMNSITLKNIFAFLLLFSPIFSFSQNTLSGKIFDKNSRQAIVGATVYIHEIKTGAISDSLGNYFIARLPTRKFLVEVKYISYSSKVIEVEISGTKKLDFELEQRITEMQEVIVTGVSSATLLKYNPVPTTIVGKALLLENSSTNIIDAISRKPGISQITTGAAISKPIIRGLGYNRVVVLYNGVRQEGQQWGDEHGIEVDEFSVERAEVIKGPGSIMYGSDALAGVINMITSTPTPEGKISSNLISNYQSNSNLFGYSMMNEGNIKGINWQARLTKKIAGNYQNVFDGKVFNSGFNEFDVNGFVGINRKWGFSHLLFSSFNQTIAMTEGERDSEGFFTKAINDSTSVTVSQSALNGYQINAPYQKVSHRRIFSTNNFIIGKSRLSAMVSYQLNQRQEFGNPEKMDAYGLYFYLPTWNYELKYFLPEINNWKTTIGISGMKQKNENKGIEFLIPNYNLLDIGGFIFVQKQFANLFLSAGIRYDSRTINAQNLYLDSIGNPSTSGNLKFSGFEVTFQNYSYSVGASYHFSQSFTSKFNVARAFRAPNLSELSSNGRHEGTFRFEHGNINLQAETSLQFDLGLEYNSEHLSIELSVFSNRIENYIYAVKLQNMIGQDSLTEEVSTYVYGQGNAQLYGGEFSVDLHPHPFDWLHFENSFSIVRAENLSAKNELSKYLPFIPAPRIQSELRANIKSRLKYFKHTYAKIDLNYFFEQNQILKENNTETETPDYTLFNAGWGSDVLNKKGEKCLSIYFSASNLFDIGYQNHLSRLKYAAVNPATGLQGVFNMGRNFSLKLVFPF